MFWSYSTILTEYSRAKSRSSIIQPEVKLLIRRLSINLTKAAYVRGTFVLNLNPENVREYFALEELYLGIPACESLEMLPSNQRTRTEDLSVNLVYLSARCLYVEVIKQIQQRFVFDDEIFVYADLLGPVMATDSTAQIKLSKFLLKCKLLNWNAKSLHDEWREMLVSDLPKITETWDF